MYVTWRDRNFFKDPVKQNEEISIALMNLAVYFRKNGGKQVLVLVDEYDAVCGNSIIHIHNVKKLWIITKNMRW